jgi:hypothetical protein
MLAHLPREERATRDVLLDPSVPEEGATAWSRKFETLKYIFASFIAFFC